MRILYLASEAVPFAKTGGLADVAGALPKYIRQLGHETAWFFLNIGASMCERLCSRV